jgi:hypothetical protein
MPIDIVASKTATMTGISAIPLIFADARRHFLLSNTGMLTPRFG